MECSASEGAWSWVGIVGNALFILWCGLWLALHLLLASGYGLIVVALVGLFLSDLFSGFVHWITDTWFDEVRFKRIIPIAREHHLYPHRIVFYPFRDYVAYSSWPSLVCIAPPGLLMTFVLAATPWVFDGVLICFVVAGIMFFGTYAHRNGHRRSKWALTRRLQAWHLLLSPAHHRIHHSDNHDIRYCVVNGWANHVCDAIGFWRGLEWLVHRVTDAVPREDDHRWFERLKRQPQFLEDRARRARRTG
jgi:plasmanylethanolamine desaturase